MCIDISVFLTTPFDTDEAITGFSAHEQNDFLYFTDLKRMNVF